MEKGPLLDPWASAADDKPEAETVERPQAEQKRRRLMMPLTSFTRWPGHLMIVCVLCNAASDGGSNHLSELRQGVLLRLYTVLQATYTVPP